nr:MAG: hypothetical protein CM15mP61_00390 [Gammaproteobacteria bacterium]
MVSPGMLNAGEASPDLLTIGGKSEGLPTEYFAFAAIDHLSSKAFQFTPKLNVVRLYVFLIFSILNSF